VDFSHLHALQYTSAPCRARTYDPLIKSQHSTCHKCKQDITSDECSNLVTHRVTQNLPITSQLQRLVTNWCLLPEAIKNAIMSLVESAMTQIPQENV
jgi:hypothetical protein